MASFETFGDAAERLTACICTFRVAEDRPDRPLG